MKVHSIDSVLWYNGVPVGVRGVTKEAHWVDISLDSVAGIDLETLKSYTPVELQPSKDGKKLISATEKASGRIARDGTFDVEATQSMWYQLKEQQIRLRLRGRKVN